jgi:uncharacterized Ntn-hydrolase superfamily protein
MTIKPAIGLVLASLAVPIATAQTRPVHTYSIVARDPATGDLGVAVQSHWFCVGCIVAWAEPGVGAVATQSFVDPSYGPRGLELMRTGKTATDALHGLLMDDQARAVRQVAFVDAEGRVGVWTGDKDIQAAGHSVGSSDAATAKVGPIDGGTFTAGSVFSVQANLMLNDRVWPAMARAFQESKGDLAERMLAALEAAQSAGGDIRGRQSAALIVVSGKRGDKPWARTFDLRVDDHPEPLKELRRLVTVNRAYNHMNAGDLAVERKDNDAALREYAAAEMLASAADGIPQSRLTEMMYWHAVALVNMGRVDESLPIFRKVFAADRNWAELTPRLLRSELLPADEKVMQRILQQAKP